MGREVKRLKVSVTRVLSWIVSWEAGLCIACVILLAVDLPPFPSWPGIGYLILGPVLMLGAMGLAVVLCGLIGVGVNSVKTLLASRDEERQHRLEQAFDQSVSTNGSSNVVPLRRGK